MAKHESDDFILTCQQTTCEFPDGPEPRLLFRLDMARSTAKTVCVVLDLSDSYDSAVQNLNKLRSAISRWPSDWRVEFFQLSHAQCLFTESVAEFRSDHQRAERHIEAANSQIPAKYRGSFLRPCMEAMTLNWSEEVTPASRIAIVLSDGQFTDFVGVAVPDWMDLVVISEQSNTKHNENWNCLEWGTGVSVAFFNKHEAAFSGKVPVVIEGAPDNATFYTVTGDELQPWRQPVETQVDLQKAAVTFLVDCEPEQAIKLSWSIRLAGELLKVARPTACELSDLLIPFVLVGCGAESGPPHAPLPKAQEAAVAALKKTFENLGGEVQLDRTGEVFMVVLNDTQITDAGLEHVRGLTSLETLALDNTQITDAGLEHLKGLTSLDWLYLHNTQITDAGLERLKGMTSLTWIDISNTQITDAGLEHLSGLTSLEKLYLHHTQITDAGLEHLTGMTSLDSLALDHT
ncbi:MAG: leucine-rich repeat domain-containing protein, partial [Planctomycetaceae bacterium]